MESNLRKIFSDLKVASETGYKSTRRKVNPPRETRTFDSLICICAWCTRVRIGDGLWVDIGVDGEDSKITHGICPECARRVRLEYKSLC